MACELPDDEDDEDGADEDDEDDGADEDCNCDEPDVVSLVLFEPLDEVVPLPVPDVLDEVVPPSVLAVVTEAVEPGREKKTTPAPSTLATPTPAVTLVSRDRPVWRLVPGFAA